MLRAHRRQSVLEMNGKRMEKTELCEVQVSTACRGVQVSTACRGVQVSTACRGVQVSTACRGVQAKEC